MDNGMQRIIYVVLGAHWIQYGQFNLILLQFLPRRDEPQDCAVLSRTTLRHMH